MGQYHEELRRLVDYSEGHNEAACGKYLIYALEYLLGKIPVEILCLEYEQRSYFGSSDFVVSARFRSDTGGEERAAYIWEIKAPQCTLMIEDGNANRFVPTRDLYKAENQLIHYLDEASYDNNFRVRYNIGATDPIRAGGIIIGSDERIVANPTGRRIQAAQRSINIRRMRLHAHENIKIITWSRIIDFLTPTENKTP